jgi:cardiolipin synthase
MDVAIGIAAFVITSVGWLLLLNLALGNKQIDARIDTEHGVGDPQFTRAMDVLLRGPLVDGNRVHALLNGDEIFPAMLGAIRGAQESITFETYIYWSGSIGREFADALTERARAGVRVRVMLDWWGSGAIEDLHLREAKAAGVVVKRYNRLRILALDRMNHRTHRKLLVVDGRVGFIGGVGIADAWRGHAQDPAHWRDTHFQVEGPVVAQLQAAFVDNWLTVTGRPLHGPAVLPPLEPVGPHTAQVFTSSPGGGSESMQFMYLMSIAAARRSVRLSMAYFVPDNAAVDTFVAARARGVRVQMIMPGKHSDRAILRRASRFAWGPAAPRGSRDLRIPADDVPLQVVIVDALWTSVGSTSFDRRSFSVDDEANLDVHDARFAREQVAIFERDLARSRRVMVDEWAGRSWRDKLLDALSGTFSSQL